ncbi:MULTISPECIES: anthranilate synthase component II [Desulfurella]|jgi:anthranilate synthase component 2|uniref:Anthranilate synthase component 2 n=1 Tax=Desulfurella multipotens TaxID=79269 RepID=A0A1G6I854_9BACT|nr:MULTISPECIES: aminodeoxychorismate/anthranilate synthase component II [Desulfurella]PMP69099.1 MAG: type 1 glutamine amidotransferase [Desulfurella multipotens]PMP89948.1 MAG: type 1 glutamine amidotransferase [Desulfurella sp.]SDC02719.1 anthranilate synthase component 2 [Desulfurella multipotens]HEX13944.1 aminodeoxychorismate/anthranilate synthase component II [Desulfurella acetivorans]
MIVLIDNFDSFTYNLYDYLKHFDDVEVILNNAKIDNIKNVKNLKGIVISPGPSHPKNALLSLDTIEYFSSKLPILGICLGMQSICYVYGKTIRKAKTIMHGKVDRIIPISDSILFKNISQPFLGVRYHSLVVDNVYNDFEVCAVSSSDNEIMAIENKDIGLYGLQFHPESYQTKDGLTFIENFVRLCHEKF